MHAGGNNPIVVINMNPKVRTCLRGKVGQANAEFSAFAGELDIMGL